MPIETRPKQRIGQSIAGLLFALIIISALDHRYGWSNILTIISILADCIVVLGFWIVYNVFKVNTYASRAIFSLSKAQNQKQTGKLIEPSYHRRPV